MLVVQLRLYLQAISSPEEERGFGLSAFKGRVVYLHKLERTGMAGQHLNDFLHYLVN